MARSQSGNGARTPQPRLAALSTPAVVAEEHEVIGRVRGDKTILNLDGMQEQAVHPHTVGVAHTSRLLFVALRFVTSPRVARGPARLETPRRCRRHRLRRR